MTETEKLMDIIVHQAGEICALKKRLKDMERLCTEQGDDNE